MIEKRQFDRFSYNITVQFEKIFFPLQDDSFLEKSYSANISTNGVAIETDFELKEEDVLSINMNLNDPSASQVNAIGTVKSCVKTNGKYTVGMEFTSIDNQDKKALQSYLKKQKVEK